MFSVAKIIQRSAGTDVLRATTVVSVLLSLLTSLGARELHNQLVVGRDNPTKANDSVGVFINGNEEGRMQGRTDY